MNDETAGKGFDIRFQIQRIWLFVQYAVRRFMRDRCLEAAGSLTFTSLLAGGPVVFMGFAVLAAFPVFDGIRKSFLDFLAAHLPAEVASLVLEYLDRFLASGGEVRTVGVVALIVTVIILLLNIEAAFNTIWRVTERRPLIWRMVGFWAVFTMGPMLLGLSLSLSSPYVETVAGVPGRDVGASGPVAWSVALVLQFAVFTIVYTIIPNRPVRFAHAASGALLASVGIELLALLFGLFGTALTTLRTSYEAIVVIPLALIGLFLGWVMALVGAVIAASIAEWGARREVLGRPHLSPGNRLAVALAILADLFQASRVGVVRRRKDLLRNLNLGAFIVEAVIDDLAKAKYLARAGRDRWVLSRDLEYTSVYELYWDLNLGVASDPFRWMQPAGWQERVGEMIAAFDAAGRVNMATTLKELFSMTDVPASRPPTPEGGA